MDYDLNRDQQALRDSVTTLLDRRAGADRAKPLDGTGRADDQLGAALLDGGFLDLFADRDAGPLEAELVTEWVAAAAGVLPIGARSLVAPAAVGGDLPALVTVMNEGDRGPIRFGASSDAVLAVGVDEARLVRLAPGATEPVRSMYGYPMARVSLDDAETLATGAAERARRWWQVALAAEIAGTTAAAFDLTLGYLKEREQFGRPIGSFQALQHRMGQVYVRSQASAWLAREASFHGAPPERAASAAAYAATTAGFACAELHQMTGAIGFTREYDLHVWTLRLQALRLEMAGPRSHARALADARWGA